MQKPAVALTLLLDITSLALKVGPKRPPIDQHIPRDHAHRSPLRQHIQECGLSGPRRSHQRRQRPRLDPPRDVVQYPPLGPLDVNVVNHIPPGKDILLRLDGRRLLLLPHILLMQLHGRGSGPILATTSPRRGLHPHLHALRHPPSRKDKCLGRARRRTVQLHRCKIDSHEEHQEPNENTKVAPHVRVAVPKVRFYVSIAAHRRPSRNRANASTDPGRASAPDLGRVRREDVRAGEFPPVELIRYHDFEGVEYGVDPPDPAEPGMHLRWGLGESGEIHEGEHQDSGEGHGLRDGLGDGREGAEDGGHDEGGDVGDQEVEEELPWCAMQTREEVDD